MREKPEAVIFDLDGVLVDTAVFHLAAWRRIAKELGFTFDDGIAESLKGVGREAALRTILRAGRIEMVPEVIVTTAKRKNEYYNDYLRSVDETALLPGAMESLTWLHDHAVPFALASASRNARTILRLTGIEPLFQAIVDGVTVTAAKPDPTVFLVAASELGLAPEVCIVLEDAVAGVEGARRAGCSTIGIGSPSVLAAADQVVPSLAAVNWPYLFERVPGK